MKRHICGTMVLLGVVLGSFCSAQAGLLGVAGEYNIFMFDDIYQTGTDVEGRVAGGGDVFYGRSPISGEKLEDVGFAVASKITNPTASLPDLVAGGNLELKNGSVGDKNSQKGLIYAGGPTINIGSNPGVDKVGYGALLENNPINFASEQKFLTNVSSSWGGLSANGSTEVLYNLGNTGKDTYRINLTGSDPSLNVFTLDGRSIDGGLGFYINAPVTSTILVNITGDSINLNNLGFYFNGIKGDQDQYPNSNILFNFLTAQLITIDQVEINGSILAPFAHVDFLKNSHIDGNLIAYSLFGEGEAHMELFQGRVPVSESATWILLGGGLMGIAALRRRMRA